MTSNAPSALDELFNLAETWKQLNYLTGHGIEVLVRSKMELAQLLKERDELNSGERIPLVWIQKLEEISAKMAELRKDFDDKKIVAEQLSFALHVRDTQLTQLQGAKEKTKKERDEWKEDATRLRNYSYHLSICKKSPCECGYDEAISAHGELMDKYKPGIATEINPDDFRHGDIFKDGGEK